MRKYIIHVMLILLVVGMAVAGSLAIDAADALKESDRILMETVR